ncbi:hypothetical protein Pelo_15629 [Pelomyxa schiedti]|nr:hypothetical protein Pelo_15629 [Pelomyxa schiedti]
MQANATVIVIDDDDSFPCVTTTAAKIPKTTPFFPRSPARVQQPPLPRSTVATRCSLGPNQGGLLPTPPATRCFPTPHLPTPTFLPLPANPIGKTLPQRARCQAPKGIPPRAEKQPQPPSAAPLRHDGPCRGRRRFKPAGPYRQDQKPFEAAGLVDRPFAYTNLQNNSLLAIKAKTRVGRDTRFMYCESTHSRNDQKNLDRLLKVVENSKRRPELIKILDDDDDNTSSPVQPQSPPPETIEALPCTASTQISQTQVTATAEFLPRPRPTCAEFSQPRPPHTPQPNHQGECSYTTPITSTPITTVTNTTSITHPALPAPVLPSSTQPNALRPEPQSPPPSQLETDTETPASKQTSPLPTYYEEAELVDEQGQDLVEIVEVEPPPEFISLSDYEEEGL